MQPHREPPGSASARAGVTHTPGWSGVAHSRVSCFLETWGVFSHEPGHLLFCLVLDRKCHLSYSPGLPVLCFVGQMTGNAHVSPGSARIGRQTWVPPASRISVCCGVSLLNAQPKFISLPTLYSQKTLPRGPAPHYTRAEPSGSGCTAVSTEA